MQAVFLNAAKLDFDGRLDFSALEAVVPLQRYATSTPEQVLERATGQTVLLTKELRLDAALIQRLPDSVRWIVEAGTGFDNLDIAAARARGIGVCNSPGYSTAAVAQLTLALLLNLSSSLARQVAQYRQGDWRNFQQFLQVPHAEVAGKTLGVIGYGAIGRQVLRLAQAFDLRCLVYSRSERPAGETIPFVPLDQLLAESDFISLHCPLSAATRHLINAQRLAQMKPSAFLINTSRGGLVDEAALIAALQAGQIAGAALDVQDPEPPSPDNPLFALDTVLLTPHIGWKCWESRQRLIGLMAQTITSCLAGQPQNLVN